MDGSIARRAALGAPAADIAPTIHDMGNVLNRHLRRMSDAGPGAGTNMESTDEDEDDVVFV